MDWEPTYRKEIKIWMDEEKDKEEKKVGRPFGSFTVKDETLAPLDLDILHCPFCNSFIQRRINAQHKRTRKHINNYKFFCDIFG